MISMVGSATESSASILSSPAQEFVAALHARFNPIREQLLARRSAEQERIAMEIVFARDANRLEEVVT